MTRLGSVLSVASLVFAAGCGAVQVVEPEFHELVHDPDPGREIVGYWFGCELGDPDDCSLLDDDGYWFDDGGLLHRVQEVTQRTEAACPDSPCFAVDHPRISISTDLLGTYRIKGDRVTLSVDGCDEEFDWEWVGSVARFGWHCEGFDGGPQGTGTTVYARKYARG